MAEDFIMRFEDRLWTQGVGHSLYPSIYMTSMEASGALLEDAMERCLRFVSKIVFRTSPERETSITSERRSSILDPPSSLTENCEGINCHVLSDSMSCSSTQRSGLGSSPRAEACNAESNEDMPKNKGFAHQVPDPNKSTAPTSGSCYVSLGPQESDDDLRSTGRVIAKAWYENISSWTDQKVITRWICRLSLAADEGSVSSLKPICYFAC